VIDVIVPTIKGREESLERCLASFPGLNHIVVKGEPTCGLGWIKGIKRSRADYLLLCADDIECDYYDWQEPRWIDACIETADQGMLPAPVVFRPNHSLESAGGDMSASGCLINELQPDWTPVDFTPMPFGSREQIEAIGMIEAHYMTDVWFSHRGRQLGYETVLRHPFRLVHHHEMVGRISSTESDQQIYNNAMEKATTCES
jgi:hypothetical protein